MELGIGNVVFYDAVQLKNIGAWPNMIPTDP
jgi:hypothetical protein